MKYDFAVKRREVGYEGFFRLDRVHVRHELFSGGYTEVVRECFERGDAAAVICYDPRLDRIVMVEQFRVGGPQEPGWSMDDRGCGRYCRTR